MNTPEHQAVNDAQDPIDRAIVAVLLEPVPLESLERTVESAASWESAPVRPTRRIVSKLAMAVIAASLVFAVLIPIYRSRRGDSVGHALFGFTDQSSGESAPVQTFMYFEALPATRPLVGDGAPVFVISPGPDQSLALGAKVFHKDLKRTRLHVWDWSQSHHSRVVDIPESHRGSALSPDGRMLLANTGRAIDIVTGEARKFEGFAVTNRQGISHIMFSNSGKYVAILVLDRSDEAEPKDPAVRPRYFLRIVELESGRTMGEFEAAGHVLPAFAADDTYIVYAQPAEAPRQHRVVRRDLPLLHVTGEYITHGDTREDSRSVGNSAYECVGIACSPDGALVAAAFYYGEIFVWEAASADRVLQFQFQRDDGTRDTFFQAKLLKFSPDGQRLAGASGSRLKIVDARSGRVQGSHYSSSTPEFAHLRWSDDGHNVLLVSYSQATEFAESQTFQPHPTADIFPLVYIWDGTQEPHALKNVGAAE